jgi:hypothetical protein
VVYATPDLEFSVKVMKKIALEDIMGIAAYEKGEEQRKKSSSSAAAAGSSAIR